MEIRQLKYFVKLCEDKSFSKAASNLYLTQQALSQSIKNLENELGTTLFIRNKAGIELTNTSQYMLSEVEVFLKKYDAMICNVQNFSKSLKGIIKIAIPPGMLHKVVPILMSSFKQSYPDIELQISEQPDLHCESSVYDGKFDIGISVAPVDDSKFKFIPLITEPSFLLVNRKNSLASHDTIFFSDLKNENLLLMDKSFKWHESVLKRCKNSSIAYTSTHPSALAELVNQNLGVTFLIPYEVNKHLCNNTLAIPIDDKENFYYSAGLIVKKSLPPRHIVTVLTDFIISQFSNINID